MYTGDPISPPDMAEGGRCSDAMLREVVLVCPTSVHGESKLGDFMLERGLCNSPDAFVILTVLPFLLCPEVDALPFVVPLPTGLEVVFQMILDGVLGRDVETGTIGWKAELDKGESGRRRPNTGESRVSGGGEALLLRRSSGV